MLVGQLEFLTVRYCECERLNKSLLLSNVRCSALGPHLLWGSPADRARRGLKRCLLRVLQGRWARFRVAGSRACNCECLPWRPCLSGPIRAMLRLRRCAPSSGPAPSANARSKDIAPLASPSAFNLIKDLRTGHLNSKRGHCRAEQFATCALLCALPSGILRCRRQRRLLRSRVSGAHWLLSTEDRSLSSSSRCPSV